MPVFHIRQHLQWLSNRRLRAVLLLGFSSGLPLALCGATLQAWMAAEGVSIKTIGLLTLVGIPYTWKFVWAPFMDRFVMPFLGRRRGWMLVTQLILAGLILLAVGVAKLTRAVPIATKIAGAIE